MPIARRPGYANATGTFIAPPMVVGPVNGIPIGTAVAIVDVNGQAEYRPCGALPSGWADNFVGFLYQDALEGKTARVTVGRGSIIQPLVEGDVPLVPNTEVYLSVVPGRVTQTNLNVPTMRRIRLGHAINAQQMTLVTDMHILLGG